MEACLEVDIPFRQDKDGYWMPHDAARIQAFMVLDAVAQRLGYADAEEYADALAYHVDDVQRRIQTLPEEDAV